jgi:tRNA dimethylallyltransferase
MRADGPQNGLLREIAEMRDIALGMYGSEDTIDHSEGIFQAIGEPVNNQRGAQCSLRSGYKEFAGLSLPQSDPATDPAFPAMLALTKVRTQQYAKSQLKWIRKQLLPVIKEARGLAGEVEVFAVPGGPNGEQPASDILQGGYTRVWWCNLSLID